MNINAEEEARPREARAPAGRRRSLVLITLLLLGIASGAAWIELRAPKAVIAAPEPEQSRPTLTAAQREAAGIIVTPLETAPMPRTLKAPGEVRVNEYTAGIVSSRITATVIERTGRLGERVTKDRPLITLYSRDVAEAQSAFVLADRNLKRLESLRDIVAGQQIDEATVKKQEASGRLESYGLTPAQIAGYAAKGLGNTGLGQFVLAAPRDGTITQDMFRIGDVVEAGKTLFEIADLRTVWVEARVAPNLVPQIAAAKATISVSGATRSAMVVQKSDIVDEATRTVAVRLQVDNGDGTLRPGQFVDVELYGRAEPVTAVPTDAVLRNMEGQWGVYVENAEGELVFHQVTPLYASGDRTAIEGIAPGTKVVTSGAFFVMSEISKSSFAEED